jgi:hypothetical protein
MLGALAAAPADAGASQPRQQDDGEVRGAVLQLNQSLQRLQTTLDTGLRGPNLDAGFIGTIRARLTLHLRQSGKFPDFMEIGINPFYDVYDWHVKYSQQIQIIRIAEQRFAIQFMFTQLIVRWEQDANYLGVPFDRG